MTTAPIHLEHTLPTTMPSLKELLADRAHRSPIRYVHFVAGAVHSYFWVIIGSAVLGLFLKPLNDSWAWAVGAVAASVLFCLCAALLVAVPLAARGYVAALQEAGRIVPAKEGTSA